MSLPPSYGATITLPYSTYTHTHTSGATSWKIYISPRQQLCTGGEGSSCLPSTRTYVNARASFSLSFSAPLLWISRARAGGNAYTTLTRKRSLFMGIFSREIGFRRRRCCYYVAMHWLMFKAARYLNWRERAREFLGCGRIALRAV